MDVRVKLAFGIDEWETQRKMGKRAHFSLNLSQLVRYAPLEFFQ